MPKLKLNLLPSYRFHKSSGQATVTIAGQDHYLGVYGTATSREKYNRLVSEWQAGGRLKLKAGGRKPSYQAYVTPIYVKQRTVRRGRSVGIFGLLRGAKAGTTPSAQVQWRPAGRKRWPRSSAGFCPMPEIDPSASRKDLPPLAGRSRSSIRTDAR